MKVTDALLGGFFVLFGSAMLWLSSQFPTFANQPYGAALLPSLLGAGFIAAGCLLALRDLRLRRLSTGPGAPIVDLVPDLKMGGAAALVAVLGNVLAQIWLAPTLGFLPVSVVGLTGVLVILRLPVLRALCIAVATSLGCWWLFVVLLRVPLPRGVLEGIL
jgi:putative tricarboxylic transport membrane protein